MLKNFLRDEEGMGTVELVLIIAALVSIAIIFRNQIINFVRNQLGEVFDAGKAGSTVNESVEGVSQSSS